MQGTEWGNNLFDFERNNIVDVFGIVIYFKLVFDVFGIVIYFKLVW